MAALQEPFLIDEIVLAVEASAGIALFPEHGTTAEVLLQFADTAMYLAKASHQDIVVYDRALDGNDPRKLALLSQLRTAINHDEFVLHYQPLIDIGTDRIRGVEALVRWQHPTEGLLPPSQFIAFAEGTGFIHELTRHVLSAACRQARVWKDDGQPLVVSVNISARCLLDTTLPETVLAALTQFGLPVALLKLEITESAIIADPSRAQSVINRLHALGVALSIDDFGTGYTSLAYLRDLPVRELKIDQSFVSRMLFNDKDAVIVRTVVELAARLGLDSVAEGIEDAETLRALADLGCTIAQGYHLGRPMPADQFDAWLTARTHLISPAPR
jgi:predicted signal transduction protein with EAL and GGDEF domain